jgi:hypothetical protein
MSSQTPADYLAGIPQAAVDYSPILPQFGFLGKAEPSAEKQSVEKDARCQREAEEARKSGPLSASKHLADIGLIKA